MWGSNPVLPINRCVTLRLVNLNPLTYSEGPRAPPSQVVVRIKWENVWRVLNTFWHMAGPLWMIALCLLFMSSDASHGFQWVFHDISPRSKLRFLKAWLFEKPAGLRLSYGEKKVANAQNLWDSPEILCYQIFTITKTQLNSTVAEGTWGLRRGM